MKDRKCEICESPTARSIHFGARACKACAAFFRRTVALNVVYECKEPVPCVIHYEKRMSCKKCRYDKCIAAKMCRELVRSTRGSDRIAHGNINNRCEASVQSESSENNDFNEQKYFTPSPANRTTDIPRTIIDCTKENRRAVIEHYKRIEVELNNRRRLMYTDTRMINVFTTVCECEIPYIPYHQSQFSMRIQPFEKKHLKPLNYKEFAGNSRADFIMLYDYAIAFMQFDELQPFEKQALYRYVCGVDNLLNSAYFTCCLSYDEKMMVLISCEYLCVEPMPMTGEEPWAQHLFANSEDLAKYKSIVPRKAALWKSLVIPFHDLHLQFDEFCLLKALICWHISHYRLGENGRKVCSRQRDLLIRCLNDLASERSSNPEEWLGNVILFTSCVFQQLLELVNSLAMITFFDLYDYDAIVKEFTEEFY